MRHSRGRRSDGTVGKGSGSAFFQRADNLISSLLTFSYTLLAQRDTVVQCVTGNRLTNHHCPRLEFILLVFQIAEYLPG